MVAGNTWTAASCLFTCMDTPKHALSNQLPCQPGQVPRTCPSRPVMHFNTRNAPCHAGQAGFTNAASAVLQKMERVHAPNQTRDLAGRVGPRQYNPPLVLAHRTYRS